MQLQRQDPEEYRMIYQSYFSCRDFFGAFRQTWSLATASFFLGIFSGN